MPLATFTCFPRLPLELRRKIVRTAALGTPIVAAEIGSNKTRMNTITREECLKVLIAHHEPKLGEPKLYFNESNGILWSINFDEMTFTNKFDAFVPDPQNGKKPKIQTLATGWEMWPKLRSHGGNMYSLMAILRNMRKIGIQEVLIVTKPSGKFSTPWEYSNVEFRGAEEFDPKNEPVHWDVVEGELHRCVDS
ncbi:hypothetical protein ONS95_001306 [Cadophora gregata]|uniref:uncharacterized protein n=1 Tax=Cadophora gregata TaxID=51156 RepID=UPI0026DCC638|nr:uncharacterized protein ONS95_001306 [Cadophora gregata]KAK0101882.1 hypothetical protein ONS96_005857 [Cadophora gregata f. sp. sojae]KAK0129380.1 hypothetical protein ONS95_001306 [Cadophora gregata]